MSVNFNTKANSLPPLSQTPDVKGDGLDPTADPFAAPTAVSEMEALFSGIHRINSLQAEHPMAPIEVPQLETDILGHAPQLGSDSISISGIVDRYQLLRNNLLDRRNNYTHALEGYLKPEEAFDLYRRLEEIDRAISDIDQNLQKTNKLETEQKGIETEKAAEAAKQQAEYLNNGRETDAKPTENEDKTPQKDPPIGSDLFSGPRDLLKKLWNYLFN